MLNDKFRIRKIKNNEINENNKNNKKRVHSLKRLNYTNTDIYATRLQYGLQY